MTEQGGSVITETELQEMEHWFDTRVPETTTVTRDTGHVLIAEVRRLNTENTRLRAQLNDSRLGAEGDAYDHLTSEVGWPNDPGGEEIIHHPHGGIL